MFKQPPPAPTVSAVGPCPTVIQIVGRPGTGSLPSTIAPPNHPCSLCKYETGPDCFGYSYILQKLHRLGKKLNYPLTMIRSSKILKYRWPVKICNL